MVELISGLVKFQDQLKLRNRIIELADHRDVVGLFAQSVIDFYDFELILFNFL